MTSPSDLTIAATGAAALSICESLILALADLKIMNKEAGDGVFADALAAHQGAASSIAEAAVNLEVVAIIERIMAGKNSIPRR